LKKSRFTPFYSVSPADHEMHVSCSQLVKPTFYRSFLAIDHVFDDQQNYLREFSTEEDTDSFIRAYAKEMENEMMNIHFFGRQNYSLCILLQS
jgi:hypothetical protein